MVFLLCSVYVGLQYILRIAACQMPCHVGSMWQENRKCVVRCLSSRRAFFLWRWHCLSWSGRNLSHRHIDHRSGSNCQMSISIHPGNRRVIINLHLGIQIHLWWAEGWCSFGLTTLQASACRDNSEVSRNCCHIRVRSPTWTKSLKDMLVTLDDHPNYLEGKSQPITHISNHQDMGVSHKCGIPNSWIIFNGTYH